MSAFTYLHRFSVIGLQFIRRPISETPAEGTMGVVDNGHGGGWTDRQPAIFKDGRWSTLKGKPLRFDPKYWIVLDYDRLANG